MKEPIDGDCLILSGMEFQTVGAAELKALRPMAMVVKGTCSRFIIIIIKLAIGVMFHAVFLTERGTSGSFSQRREILAEEDAVPASATLWSRGGNHVHGSVGRGVHTVTALQSPVCHLSHLQEDGRTLSQVVTNTCYLPYIFLSSLDGSSEHCKLHGTIHKYVSHSVLLIVGPKCSLVASHAAPW